MSIDKMKLRLVDCINTVSTITCSSCNKSEHYGGDAFDVLDAMANDGWYAATSNVYCKRCNVKRKNKKQ